MLLLFVSSIALLIISITLFVRAADLGAKNLDLSKIIRLSGFVLAGSMPIPLMFIQWYNQRADSWYGALFYIGLAAVFATTPYLPPWWKYISTGNIRQDYHQNRRKDDNNEPT
jgi:hypothetical protein